MRSRGEFSFIDDLKQRAQLRSAWRSKDLAVGIGDDAAVWRNTSRYESVISTDLLVETIDFRLDWKMSPVDLGHKALAVSLSDLAAMGARPRWALVSVGVTTKLWSGDFLDCFFEGFFALAESHRVTLIGGDISQTPERVVIDSIVIGQVKRRRAVLRGGAKIGDALFVTGGLGGAAAGLSFLQKTERRQSTPQSKTKASSSAKALQLRQLRPVPRVAWGALLGEKQLASAMIDISDGLSSDLHHLCRASQVGAKIDLADIPGDALLTEAGLTAHEAMQCALHGGEDFELLFTVPRNKVAKLPSAIAGVPVTRIGEITARQNGVKIYDGRRWRKFEPAGFTHFKQAK